MFDINKFKNNAPSSNRYEKRLQVLKTEGKKTECIEKAVEGALKNLEQDTTSFIIYGDPQSGKTEMMIALTAKLLDKGHKIIIVLLNDNVELLKQNLNRFTRSGIDPTPKNFTEIIDADIKIGSKEWVVFCKKNSNDLSKLISKVGDIDNKVIIDDEGDYATPNSKINQNDKAKINQLVGELLGDSGIYIGVTATPARLDLNNTFENANDKWVYFPPHDSYTGQDVFFPVNLKDSIKFKLTRLPVEYDDPKYLRDAFFRFLVNVAYLNIYENKQEKNYCMLIHTSGQRVDHSDDYKQVVDFFNILKNENDGNYSKYVEQIWKLANENYKSETSADEITSYIVKNVSRQTIVLMNSASKTVDYTNATIPAALFTIAIGGNIISRGVTFDNLLSMFFTRDAKHKIQQDTYIQRARMFGARGQYLRFFELTIPEKLYLDWHRCFVFHRLALESTKNGNAPVWLEDSRIKAVSSSSIDKTTVAMDSGEMSFEIFAYTKEIEQIIDNETLNSIDKLKNLQQKLGSSKLPPYLKTFIENFSPDGRLSLAIHQSTDISNRGDDTDKEKIERSKGLIGTTELEENKYPHAIHHIKIFYNSNSKARVFYKYVADIKFIKNLKVSSI